MKPMWAVLIVVLGLAGIALSVVFGGGLLTPDVGAAGDTGVGHYVFTYLVPLGIVLACASLLWRLSR